MRLHVSCTGDFIPFYNVLSLDNAENIKFEKMDEKEEMKYLNKLFADLCEPFWKSNLEHKQVAKGYGFDNNWN